MQRCLPSEKKPQSLVALGEINGMGRLANQLFWAGVAGYRDGT